MGMVFWRQVGLFCTSRCPLLCAFLCLHVRWLYNSSGMRIFFQELFDDTCLRGRRCVCVLNSRLRQCVRQHAFLPSYNDGVRPRPASASRPLVTKNITCIDTEIRYCDGDGVVVRNSQNVNIDAGSYDE